MVCYDNRTPLYEEIIKDGLYFLENGEEICGDDINCYLLAYEFLTKISIKDIVDMNTFKNLLCEAIENCICKDTLKYGIEYVPMPCFVSFSLQKKNAEKHTISAIVAFTMLL